MRAFEVGDIVREVGGGEFGIVTIADRRRIDVVFRDGRVRTFSPVSVAKEDAAIMHAGFRDASAHALRTNVVRALRDTQHKLFGHVVNDGLCANAVHGIDWLGQRCDLCEGARAHRVS
jgi:hypothetical protein